MKKLLSFASAAVIAVALSASVATPSSANPTGAAIAGGMLGFMAGAAMAGGLGPNYHYHDSDYGRWRSYGSQWGFDDWRWRQHVRACFAAYGGAYNPQYDAYIGHDGRPHRCRL